MLVLLILALAFPSLSARAEEAVPDVTAPSWIVYDDTYDYVIAASQPDVRRPMASTTKLMTALLTVESLDPDQPVTISRRAAATGHKQVGLRRGEVWAAEELLEAVMVVSANDAAVALAEHVSGDVAGFVDRMNARALALGLHDTTYANPHGLDAAGHLTTARDLLSLARIAMAQPRLAELAGRSEARLAPVDGRASTWESTNELLETYTGTVGVKTGWTSQAGDVLVAAADREERRVYAVVLGSRDANTDVAALLEYGFAAFGSAERRLVPLMDDSRYAPIIRNFLPAETVARLGHLRWLNKQAEVPWE